jgi:hypothetical protein
VATRPWCCRRSRELFHSKAKWCAEVLRQGRTKCPGQLTAVLRSILWCQAFALSRQGQRRITTATAAAAATAATAATAAAACAASAAAATATIAATTTTIAAVSTLQHVVDDIVVCFAHCADAASLEHTPAALVVSYLKLCVGVLERSQNLDVIPVLAQLSHRSAEMSGKLVAGCLPSIFSVGLALGLGEPAGDVICKIVRRALQDKACARTVAPWFLALWLSQPDAGSLFRGPDSVAVELLLPHVSKAADILVRLCNGNVNDDDAAAAHRLAQNLLSMLAATHQNSGHHLSSPSFHMHATKLFWRVNMHSPRSLRNASFEEDVLDEDDEFDEDSSASDEPLDLADEFDLVRSRRIYASLRRHHRQIDGKSYRSPGSPRGIGGDGDAVFQYFFDVDKWHQLAEADMAASDPDFAWSVPVGVLTARKAKQPNLKKVLARLRPPAKLKRETMGHASEHALPAVPRLRELFPATEENVCALIYANAGRDFDLAVETLSQMTGQSLVISRSSPSSLTSPSSSPPPPPPPPPPLLPIDLRLRVVDLWNALNRCYGYGAMRIAGDKSIRNAFPALLSACYLFVMTLFYHYMSLDNAAFDDPANHPLPRETSLSDVAIFLQILIGSLQESRKSGSAGGGTPDPLVLYALNACQSLYTLLLYHHKRAPWIRNTSDIVDADMKMALEADRLLRAKQDADFVAAMVADQREAEAEKKREEAAAIARREEQDAAQARGRHRLVWAQALQDKEERVAQETSAAVAAVAAASAKKEGAVIALRVRFPSGKAETLRLLGEATLSVVFDFVDVVLAMEEATAFELVRTHPRRSFCRGEDGAKTLEELELSRATLLVKDLGM